MTHRAPRCRSLVPIASLAAALVMATPLAWAGGSGARLDPACFSDRPLRPPGLVRRVLTRLRVLRPPAWHAARRLDRLASQLGTLGTSLEAARATAGAPRRVGALDVPEVQAALAAERAAADVARLSRQDLELAPAAAARVVEALARLDALDEAPAIDPVDARSAHILDAVAAWPINRTRIRALAASVIDAD
jgi:hypothetical protein